VAGAVRRVGVQERRARLARRHHLAPAARAAGVVEAARDLVGLHATVPASVFLAAAARVRAPEVAAVERALYEDRLLLRMLGMRRTMFVVPVELAPVVHAACTQAIAVAQRRLTVQLLDQSGIAEDPARWLEEVEAATLEALEARGGATAAELTAAEPRLRHQVQLAEGKTYASRQNVTTRVLLQLAADGRIVRGRPRGSWISSQYRWSPIGSWLPGGMAAWSTEAAQAELVRRWLAGFGPGTAADLKWWTGLTAGQVKRALAAAGAVEVDLDGTPGLVLADDLEPPPPAEPWVALLATLDPTVMGWSGREWYLGEHGQALFDRNGNAGPTVWWDGRIVGGWAQRRDGEVAVRLLEDVGAEGVAAVEAAAGRLQAWLGDVRVTPQFRTPLERELSA
jgi:Winged helix DNA-binding domain